jgi:hypothetical protein
MSEEKQPENLNQGRRPDQFNKTLQILEWLLFGVVIFAFGALMWKLGTLTWNFLTNLF